MSDCVQGHIGFLGLPEYLQFAGFNHRSIVMELHSPDIGRGQVYLRDGKVIHAAHEAAVGPEALFRLLAAGNAMITIADLPADCPQTVTLSMEQILLRLVMSMPAPGSEAVINPNWYLEGTTRLLSIEEILQIFESNRRAATVRVGAGAQAVEFTVASGALCGATGGGMQGPEAVYRALIAGEMPFVMRVPPQEPDATKRFDIPSLVMEGLRRRDEAHLVQAERSGTDNEHAQEMLASLDAGSLSEAERLAMAKRYLPGGAVTPAVVLVRLVVDPDRTVRQTALASIEHLPSAVRQALANDTETPQPLLRYFLEQGPDTEMLHILLENPSTPKAAIAAVAGTLHGPALEMVSHRADLLEDRAIRTALRANPACTIMRILDEIDARQPAIAQPKARRIPFGGFAPAVPAAIPSAATPTELHLEKPPENPDVVMVETAPTYADLLMMAMKGSSRQRVALAKHSDETIATTAVSTPGLPDMAIEQIAASPTSNPSALKIIGSSPRWKRMSTVMSALLFNPKAPFSVTRDYAYQQSVGVLRKVAENRDLPTPLQELAEQLIKKKSGH